MLCSDLPPRIYESLKTLCCLAVANRPLQAHEIASAANLPPAQTAKILQMMTWAGFVKSRRGTRGGFWLIKPAETIRVTDVADFFAHHDEANCSQQDALLKALEQATARYQEEFSRITVADLAKVSGCEREKRGVAIANSAADRRKPKRAPAGRRRAERLWSFRSKLD
jgi:Rrf2 family protein